MSEHIAAFVEELRRRARLIERSDVVSAELLSRAATFIEMTTPPREAGGNREKT